jgi:ankyrin repeat protein
MDTPLSDLAFEFLEAASAPRRAHRSGTLDQAEAIRARFPDVAIGSIYAAAVLGDSASVLSILGSRPASATTKGGPRQWDALTQLCFSRYLRLDPSRSDAFVRTARALLDAGANPNTGWYETSEDSSHPPEFEAAIYGAAAIAQHAGLTRLLLEQGADPNDGETAYHVIETRDNTVLRILLESGKFNGQSFATLLCRKCDWHDEDGLRLILEYGANPNRIGIWGKSAIHQAVLRDNDLRMIELLLEYGADPAALTDDGTSAIVLAAHRGRASALELFQKRAGSLELTGVDALIAACAAGDEQSVRSLVAAEPHMRAELIRKGGTLLAQFAGVGNLQGVRHLLDLGVSVREAYREGDVYYGIAKDSTALHVAAWRARTEVVKELIARGAPVDATDGQGRTALQLAVKACVDSYWTDRRSPDSVRALLDAGASPGGIAWPTGYEEIDRLLHAR